MRKWLLLSAMIALAGVVAAFSSARHTPPERLGVILLHGKLGTPTDRRAGLDVIARNLEANGQLAALPTMPWDEHGWTNIAVDVPGSLGMIDTIASSLRARGASRIVLGGHSLGANIALAYAVTHGGVAGLVMAAPGHRPEALVRRDPATQAAVAEARRLVDAGRGATPFVGPDGIQGASLTLRTTAAIYLSWMDPEGLAAMEVQASRLPPSIPLLMVVSRRDPFYGQALTSLYQRGERHPYSRYLPIGADHSTTPMAASTVIQSWIEGLPR